MRRKYGAFTNSRLNQSNNEKIRSKEDKNKCSHVILNAYHLLVKEHGKVSCY